jgi:hypothetical protein
MAFTGHLLFTDSFSISCSGFLYVVETARLETKLHCSFPAGWPRPLIQTIRIRYLDKPFFIGLSQPGLDLIGLSVSPLRNHITVNQPCT